jgi:16S rRNA G966 N2-methylase RsmD
VAKNQLYYGDNLDILRRRVAAESVDLVYLDPPFNSNQDYDILFQDLAPRRMSGAFGEAGVESPVSCTRGLR